MGRSSGIEILRLRLTPIERNVRATKAGVNRLTPSRTSARAASGMSSACICSSRKAFTSETSAIAAQHGTPRPQISCALPSTSASQVWSSASSR